MLGADKFLADYGTKRILQQLKLDHADCTSLQLNNKGSGVKLVACGNSSATGCTGFVLATSNNTKYCQDCRERGKRPIKELEATVEEKLKKSQQRYPDHAKKSRNLRKGYKAKPIQSLPKLKYRMFARC